MSLFKRFWKREKSKRNEIKNILLTLAHWNRVGMGDQIELANMDLTGIPDNEVEIMHARLKFIEGEFFRICPNGRLLERIKRN